MAVKKLKPINNSSRNTVLLDYKKILHKNKKKTPRKLIKKIKENSGRTAHGGFITVRHQKGWHKKKYRIIDFKRRENDGIVGKIKSIEYDPNRNCFISLISYLNGNYSYIISPEGVKIGDQIISGDSSDIPASVGNNLPIGFLPPNTFIHNLEIKPEKGGQFLRSAGCYGEIIGKEENGKYTKVKLRSKEIRKVLSKCRATVGKVGNGEINLVRLGKAGRTRWRRVGPTVRGSAMNPCDHPHGGGEGKAGIGHKSPLDPWGNKTLGKKTRKKNKSSNKFILQTRNRAKKK